MFVCWCTCCLLLLQAVGQLTYIRPYVTDFSPEWLLGSSMSLVAGAMALIYVAGALTAYTTGMTGVHNTAAPECHIATGRYSHRPG